MTAIKGYLHIPEDNLAEAWRLLDLIGEGDILLQSQGEGISLRQRLHRHRHQHGGFAYLIIRAPVCDGLQWSMKLERRPQPGDSNLPTIGGQAHPTADQQQRLAHAGVMQAFAELARAKANRKPLEKTARGNSNDPPVFDADALKAPHPAPDDF